jgi:uncharacterized membrane protein
MKLDLKKELPLFILAITPIVYLRMNWSKLPEQVAIHFDIDGIANGWSSKLELFYMTLGIMIGTYLLLKFLPRIDPKKQMEDMGNKYYKVKLLILALVSSVFTFVTFLVINENANSKIMFIIFGVFFISLGNLMQTIKPNYFIGIRTPWTVQSDFVWKEVHKLTGVIMIVSGIITLIAYFFFTKEYMKYTFYLALFVSVVVPYLYSFYLFKKEEATK